MPLISVIVPVYKVEPYLRRCVDSLLAQSFSDLELILVDDGSPDNCGAICDEYAARDGRVHVIHKENGGLSSARNAGIDWAFQNSDSRWLAFVDSDDWVHPQYLELLYRAAVENDVPVSACNYQKVFGDQPEPPVLSEATVTDWETVLIEHDVQAVIACNKLLEKSLFEGLRFPVGRIHEDEFLTYRLLHRAQRLAYLPAQLYYYYQNPAGITHAGFSLKSLDKLLALEERARFTRRHGHRPLFLRDLRICLNKHLKAAEILRAEETIPLPVRTREIRHLRRRVRRMLLRWGIWALPLRKSLRYYRFAFPVCARIAGAMVRPVRRLFKNGRG